MTITLVYMVGAPGAGKSTAMRAATAGLVRTPMPVQPYIARDALFDNGRFVGVELGAQRPEFSGTDALAMNAITRAVRYLTDLPEQPPVIVGEGARLGNARFLTAAVDAGMDVTLLHLDNPDAQQWAATRAQRLGKEQNAAWAQGRATASVRLADDPPPGVQVLTVTSPEQATLQLQQALGINQ